MAEYALPTDDKYREQYDHNYLDRNGDMLLTNSCQPLGLWDVFFLALAVY